MLLQAGSCDGAEAGGPSTPAVGWDHAWSPLLALLLGHSRGAFDLVLGVTSGQEQGRAGAGVPLLAHEGEHPGGRDRVSAERYGTTPSALQSLVPASPLLGLRGDDGLGQEVPVEL